MTTLGRAVEDYLALRGALGFAQTEDAPQLRAFARFLEAQGASHITIHLAMRWAQLSSAGPARWATRLGWVRRLARHLSASDAKTEIPPAGLLPSAHRRKQPYLYTDVEVRKLLAAAQRLPSRMGLRPATYSTLIGLLAVTGLRSSEVIALDDPDVDLVDGVITIRRTKFRKSRLVTVHASTVEALRRYRLLRDKACPRRATEAFFASEAGRRLSKCTIERTFAKLSRQTGLGRSAQGRGPRLHDLRHRLAITTLIRWYRSGLNVEALLPVLSTYLGHVQVGDTYWYLTAVPELLRLAADRLEHREAPR
jgi:integrase/recombinase XerD